MTKRQLITEITHLNPTAAPSFLARFDDADLAEYLEHLHWVAPSQCPDGASQARAADDASSADERPPTRQDRLFAEPPARGEADEPDLTPVDEPDEDLAVAECVSVASDVATSSTDDDSRPAWLF